MGRPFQAHPQLDDTFPRRARVDALGPPDQGGVFVSSNYEEALEVEVARLRLKDDATARALHRLYLSLKHIPEAKAGVLAVFPEAAEAAP